MLRGYAKIFKIADGITAVKRQHKVTKLYKIGSNHKVKYRPNIKIQAITLFYSQ